MREPAPRVESASKLRTVKELPIGSYVLDDASAVHERRWRDVQRVRHTAPEILRPVGHPIEELVDADNDRQDGEPMTKTGGRGPGSVVRRRLRRRVSQA